ncbi:MAG: DUF4403 family protein [Syntrophothermus sp.]
MKRFCFAAFSIVLLLLCSCHSTLKIESPAENYAEPPVAPVYSDITFPVELEIVKLEKKLNDQFNGVIYQDTSYENNQRDDLKITAWKAGDFKIYMEGNEITYKIPLNLWIKKRTVIGALGYKYTDEREVTAGIALNFRTKVSVTKDWNITTLTTSEGYEWIKQPVVKIGPVSFPLTVIADVLIASNQKIINKSIDRALLSILDIRGIMTDVWKKVQEPVRIEGDYPLWLKITPREVRMVSPRAADGKLKLSCSIRCLTELFYNEVAPAYLLSASLPQILFTSKIDDISSINLVTDIPFSHINELAAGELKGYTIRQGKYTVMVDNIILFGSGDKLVIATDLSGSVKGTVYFSGKPYFDRAAHSFKINDLDFDVKTRNVLIRSASWLYHNNFLESVQQKLNFPVAVQLGSIKEQLQTVLNENAKQDMFRFSGVINKVDIGNIYITRAGIRGIFEFSGNTKITLDQ